jgi:hypothetical protein
MYIYIGLEMLMLSYVALVKAMFTSLLVGLIYAGLSHQATTYLDLLKIVVALCTNGLGTTQYEFRHFDA